MHFALCALVSHQIQLESIYLSRSVTDPRDGKVVALKKIPNVFQNLISARRVYREMRMLSFFKHENVSDPFIVLLFILTPNVAIYFVRFSLP